MSFLRHFERILRLEYVILFLWLVLFAIHAGAPLSDPDTPWHLATGNYILSHHRIPRTDPFSWSMLGHPWVTQEWLFEVVLALLANHFGFFGIWCLVVFLHTATVLFVYKLCVSVSDGQRVFSAIAAVLSVVAGLAFWVVRPQLVSYTFFALFLWILERVRRGHLRTLWLVPPIILVWANAHASVSIGIAMLLFEVVISFIPTIGRLERIRLPRLSRRYLLLVTVISIVVGLLNPNTYHEFTYALLSTNKLMVNNINEWHSPDFHSHYFKHTVIPFLSGILLIVIARYRPVFLKYVLYFGGCFALTLVYQRFMPYLAIAGAPLVSIATKDWLRSLMNPSRVIRYVYAACMVGIVLDLDISEPYLKGSVSQHFASNAYPIKSVNYIKSHSVPSPMLNAYDFGGYLIYRGVPTFVDGRTGIFLHNKVFQNYMDLQNLAWDAPNLLNKYNFQSALLPSGYSLSVYLTHNPDWKIVYSGPNAEVFVRTKSSASS